MNSIENTKIADTIIKHLFRSLKKHHLITKFIESLYGSNNFFSIGASSDKIVSIHKSVSNILGALLNDMSDNKISAIANPKFDVIMFTINHILQRTLDKKQDMAKTLGIGPEIVGEEIFTNVCLELYGTEFSLFLQNMEKMAPKRSE